jgi:hypothetical protein
MTATSTNLHFHGLTVPAAVPSGRRAEALRSSRMIRRSNTDFAFRSTSRRACIGTTLTFTASARTQVLGGASGALIIEGIERANHELAGLA